MPIPLIKTGRRAGLQRKRTKDGRWTKKRSDTGVPRGKYHKTRSDKGKKRGFSEDVLAFLNYLKLVEEGKRPPTTYEHDEDFEIY